MTVNSENLDIDDFRDLIHEKDQISCLGVNSEGGYEVECQDSDSRQELKRIVDNNDIRFENRARILTDQKRFLILPEDWGEKF